MFGINNVINLLSDAFVTNNGGKLGIWLHSCLLTAYFHCNKTFLRYFTIVKFPIIDFIWFFNSKKRPGIPKWMTFSIVFAIWIAIIVKLVAFSSTWCFCWSVSFHICRFSSQMIRKFKLKCWKMRFGCKLLPNMMAIIPVRDINGHSKAPVQQYSTPFLKHDILISIDFVADGKCEDGCVLKMLQKSAENQLKILTRYFSSLIDQN